MSGSMNSDTHSSPVGGDTSFLGGKVIRRVLPVIQAPSPEMPLLKRLMLAQGKLDQFYDAEQGIHYIVAIELRENCVRGNHFHREKEEWVYIVQGGLMLHAADINTGESASFTMGPGELSIVRPGVAHAYRTTQPGLAIEFSPTRFNAADIQVYALPAVNQPSSAG
jgi:hypothetical protein